MLSKIERIKILDLDHGDRDFIEGYCAAREPIDHVETLPRVPVDIMIRRETRQ